MKCPLEFQNCHNNSIIIVKLYCCVAIYEIYHYIIYYAMYRITYIGSGRR